MYVKVANETYLGQTSVFTTGEGGYVPAGQTQPQALIENVNMLLDDIKNNPSLADDLWKIVTNTIEYLKEQYGYKIEVPPAPTPENVLSLQNELNRLLGRLGQNQQSKIDWITFLPWILIVVAVVILIFAFK